MFTTGSKYFYAVAFFALAAAMVWGFVTYGSAIGMGTFVGIVSLGFKGGVGAHVGYSIFVGVAGVALFLGSMSTLFRDADPQAVAEVVAADEVPAVRAPQGYSIWPAVAAFGVGLIIIGVVFESALVVAGIVVVAVAAAELAVRSWAERATGNARVNLQIRNRAMYPFELPLLALVGVVIFTVGFSRILVAAPEEIETILFAAIPGVALLVACLVSAKPKISRPLASALLTIGAVVILAAGVVGLAKGQRHFENLSHEGPHYVPPLPPGPLGKPNIGVTDPGLQGSHR